MDHLERVEDLMAAIRMDEVLEDYLLCKLFKYTLTGEAMHWLKQLLIDHIFYPYLIMVYKCFKVF